MIKIICIGKIKDSKLKSLIDDYYKRISKYTSIQIIELKDENEILDLADYSNRLLIITENYIDYSNLDKEIVIERDKAYKYILSGMSWDVL